MYMTGDDLLTYEIIAVRCNQWFVICSLHF